MTNKEMDTLRAKLFELKSKWKKSKPAQLSCNTILALLGTMDVDEPKMCPSCSGWGCFGSGRTCCPTCDGMGEI